MPVLPCLNVDVGAEEAIECRILDVAQEVLDLHVDRLEFGGEQGEGISTQALEELVSGMVESKVLSKRELDNLEAFVRNRKQGGK